MRGGEGFAVALSRKIADRLDRDLRVQWFVSRDDPDANLAKDADTLLSDGHCQLVAEYPLVSDMLGQPYAPTAKLPPFDGATPEDRRRWIKLGALVPTRPYRLDTLTVVLAAKDGNRPIHTLADLQGLKLGVQTATLADAIAMRYAGGRLIENVMHVPDARALFGRLQRGELDAAFVAQREVDAWKRQHGADGLAPTGYAHSIGFNMGYVGLASERKLVDDASAAVAALQASDAVRPLARAAGLTYAPPREPAVQPGVRPDALAGD
ncbi:MAG: transporter substrate-binding domain-containing protein [Alphaproteobacteria bacterium]|nr:transporter substrate-binding domain-containing protein [Alphaproteobacteria bacterium]